jgi:hypothetical protein
MTATRTRAPRSHDLGYCTDGIRDAGIIPVAESAKAGVANRLGRQRRVNVQRYPEQGGSLEHGPEPVVVEVASPVRGNSIAPTKRGRVTQRSSSAAAAVCLPRRRRAVMADPLRCLLSLVHDILRERLVVSG